MKEFNLNAKITISVYTKVNANSLKEAIEIAKTRDVEKYNWSDNNACNENWINEE